MNLIDFVKRFPTEQACINHFRAVKDIKQQQFKEQSSLIALEKSKIDSTYSISIETKRGVVESLRTSWMVAAEEARKEADGTGGSGIRGISKITALKLVQAENLKGELDNAELTLASLLNEKEQKLNKATSSIESELHGDSVLARVKSLFNLVLNDAVAGITYLFFTVFLFSLEFIVIIMKHSLPETNYDKRIAAMEQVGKRRLERMLQSGVQSFDPVEESIKEQRMELELKKSLPTLFTENRDVRTQAV